MGRVLAQVEHICKCCYSAVNMLSPKDSGPCHELPDKQLQVSKHSVCLGTPAELFQLCSYTGPKYCGYCGYLIVFWLASYSMTWSASSTSFLTRRSVSWMRCAFSLLQASCSAVAYSHHRRDQVFDNGHAATQSVQTQVYSVYLGNYGLIL